MKITKIILATLVMFVATTAGLSAQASNISGATAGIIKSDVDYCMEPTYYKEAAFNNFLVYANVNDFINFLDVTEPSYLELGFAKQFSNFYMSSFYNGNLWGQIDTITVDDEKKTYTEASCENNMSVLIGFLNMGVKVDLHFAPTILTYENPNLAVDKNNSEKIINGKERVPKYTDTSLRATWGGSFDCGSISLKPSAYIGDHLESSEDTTKENGFFNQNIFEAGLGFDFGYSPSEKFTLITGLKYDFGMGVRKNPKASDENEAKKDIMNNFLDIYGKVNYIINDRFEIGGKVDVANTLTAEKYILTPKFSLGASCDAIASVLKLGLGVDIALPDLLTSVMTKDIAFDSSFYTGAAFKLGQSAILDFKFDVPIGTTTDGNIFNKIAVGVSYRK